MGGQSNQGFQNYGTTPPQISTYGGVGGVQPVGRTGDLAGLIRTKGLQQGGGATGGIEGGSALGGVGGALASRGVGGPSDILSIISRLLGR